MRASIRNEESYWTWRQNMDEEAIKAWRTVSLKGTERDENNRLDSIENMSDQHHQ